MYRMCSYYLFLLKPVLPRISWYNSNIKLQLTSIKIFFSLLMTLANVINHLSSVIDCRWLWLLSDSKGMTPVHLTATFSKNKWKIKRLGFFIFPTPFNYWLQWLLLLLWGQPTERTGSLKKSSPNLLISTHAHAPSLPHRHTQSYLLGSNVHSNIVVSLYQ